MLLFNLLHSQMFTEAKFSPTDIANLSLWLDASDTSTITEIGGAVSQWDDKSGNNNHSWQTTASYQPVTGTRTINGLNVLDFDGDYMSLPYALFSIPSSSNTIIAIVSRDITDTSQRIITGAVGNSSKWGMFYNKGPGGIYKPDVYNVLNRTSFDTTEIPIVADTSLHIATLRRSGTVIKGSHDGGIETIGNNAEDATIDTLKIGTTGGGADDFLNGVISEIMIFNRDLTDTEMNQLGNYLANKWGTTWTDI